MKRLNETEVRVKLGLFQGPPGDSTNADLAAEAANTAAQEARNAAVEARSAANAATSSASGVDGAVSAANNAADRASGAADNAATAASAANNAAASANAATNAANVAAAQAQSATENAVYETNRASAAATAANTAEASAKNAASSANSAAAQAVTAATAANEAAEDANSAAGAAGNAANRANAEADTAAANTQALKDVHPQAVAATKAANEAAESANAAAAKAQTEAANAQEAAAQADAAREGIEGEIGALWDGKADAILDTSARAAAHTLHAQRGRLGVTLYGKTTEMGTGDKSPDNPYVISGVDAARVHCGGKNLLDMPEHTGVNAGITAVFAKDGTIKINGTATSSPTIMAVLPEPLYIKAGYRVVFSTSENFTNASFGLRTSDNTIVTDNTLGATETKVQTIGDSKDGMVATKVWFYTTTGNVHNNTVIKFMITAPDETTTVHEPYNANTIDLPLLPDGAPLMGNGTVDDTVENDVLSGCDKSFTLDGTTEIQMSTFTMQNGKNAFYVRLPKAMGSVLPEIAYGNSMLKVEQITASVSHNYPCFARHADDKYIRVYVPGIESVEDMKAYLAANPLTVYYRSTDYTPDKDLRVCRTVRKWKTVTLDGTESITAINTDAGTLFSFVGQMRGASGDLAVNGGICSHFPVGSTSTGNSVQGCGGWNEALYLRLAERFTTTGELTAWLSEQYAAGTPVTVWYNHAPDGTYMTDPIPLRKPDTLTTDTVTVTGSGETAVEYPHDTKHYIDSKISELVTLALANN